MAREEGISKLTAFPITADAVDGSPIFGQPERIPWAVNIETEDQNKEGAYYGDNMVEETKNTLSSVEVTMEVSSDIPPKKDAFLTGKGYKNGKAYKRPGQKSPALALAYEILMSDGNVRRRILYNVGLTRPSHKNQTIEDEATGQTYTYNGVALPLKSTTDVELIMDKKEISELEEGPEKEKLIKQWDAFFEKPVLPDEEGETA